MAIYKQRVCIVSIIIIALVFFVLLSGCIIPQLKYCENDSGSKEVCGYTPSLNEISNACKASTQIPEGYLFCEDEKSCKALFESSFELNKSYFDNQITFYVEQSKEGLIESWVSANNIAKFLSNTRKECDDLFEVLLSKDYDILEAKETDYLQNMTKFRLAYEQYNTNHIMSLYYTKTYLENQNILLMADTKLYEKYALLTNYTNNYVDVFGTDLNLPRTNINEDIEFYSNYFGDNKENIKQLLAESSEYSKCLLENNNDVNKCYVQEYKKESTELSQLILDYFLGFDIGFTGFIAGSLLFLSSPQLYKLVTGAIFDADSAGNWTKKFAERIRSVTDLEEWESVSQSKTLLDEFRLTYGASSESVFNSYNLINEINYELEYNNKVLNENYKTLVETIELLQKQNDEINLIYLKHKILLGKFFQQKNNLDFKSDLDKINLRLENLKTKSLGLRYSEYKTIDSELSKLSKEITISRQINEDYLEMKCDDYILSNNNNSDVIAEYIKKYWENKSNKLELCRQIIIYSDAEYDFDCKSQLKIFTKNLGVELRDYENCNIELTRQINEFLYTNKYYELKSKLDLLNEIYSNLMILRKQSSCVDYKEISKIQIYPKSIKYSSDSVISLLFEYSYSDLSKKLVENINHSEDLFSSNLGCYFKNNYSLNLETKKLIFDNPFGSKDIKFDFKISDERISGIYIDDCLDSVYNNNSSYELKFRCLDEKMNYNITTKESVPKTKIKIIQNNMNSANILYEYCLSSIYSSQIYVSHIVDYDKIVSADVYNGLIKQPFELNSSGINIFTNPTPEKTCFNIYLQLQDIIYFDYDFVYDNNKYKYTINIINNTLLNYENILYYLPNSLNSDESGISLYNSEYKKYSVKCVSDKITFVDDLASSEIKEYTLLVNIQLTESELNSKIDDIIFDLEKYLTISNAELVTDITNQIFEWSILKENKTNYLQQKLKDYLALEKKYIKLKENISNYMSLEKRYVDAKSKLVSNQNDYYFNKLSKYSEYGAELSEGSDLTKLLSEAESLYSKGDVSAALKLLENADAKNLDKMLMKILSEISSKLSNTLKTADKLKLSLSINKESLDVQKQRIIHAISSKDYNFAISELDKYNETLKDLGLEITEKISKELLEIDELLSDYNDSILMLDATTKTITQISEAVDSEYFSKLESLGITYTFKKSYIVNISKNKDKLYETYNSLATIKNNYLAKKSYSKLDAVLLFKKDDFKEFNSESMLFSESVGDIFEELKQVAEESIIVAQNKYAENAPIELYKAKEYYENEHYIDATYFARISLLNTKKSNDLLSSIIIGSLFLLLLIFIFIKFRTNITGLLKPIKKKKKITYYTVDSYNDQNKN